jgi:hypothetical protein
MQVLVRERWVAEQFLTRTAHRDQGSASFMASQLFNYITYTTESFHKVVIEKQLRSEALLFRCQMKYMGCTVFW